MEHEATEAKGNPKVPHSFLYLSATTPVLVFTDPKEATKFTHEYKAGHFHYPEMHNDPLQVFLPKYAPRLIRIKPKLLTIALADRMALNPFVPLQLE